jgi:hypothetical protein
VQVTLDLCGAYPQHPFVWDPDALKYFATVDFDDGGRVNTTGESSGGPTGEPDGCGTAAIADGPTDAATSLEPDTRKDGHLTHGKVRQNNTLLGAHSGTVSDEGQLQKVYKNVHLLPSFLVSGLISPDHPRLQAAEARSDPKARLIGQDGTSIVGQDGTSLIGQDGTSIVGDAGASLIMNDRGRLVAAGGNIVATDGATAVGNSHGQIVATDGATLSSRAVSSAHAGQAAQPKYGACALGYKTVGKGMTRLIDGARMLARDDGTLVSRTLFIGARNAMPVNAPAAP